MYFRFSALLLIAGLPSALLADTTSRPYEEVIVKAGFYDTKLMESAGSISVLDEAVITDRSARHLEEILGVLPNVSFTGGGGRARFVQVRGIGDLEQFVDPKHFPSVGITIDGIEVGTTATGSRLMDVQQVEVLRGPQGTRFGANALAGMINIRTSDPSDILSGYVDAGYANFDTWNVGAALSGPLTERVGARISLSKNSSDGFLDNTFLGRDNTNKRDEFSSRGKLHWSPSNDADIRLTAAYSNIDNGYDAFSLENNRRTRTDRPGTDAQEAITVGLSTNWTLNAGLQLETQLSWSDVDEQYGFDEDWVFAGFCDGVTCNPLVEFNSTDLFERDREVFSADVRIKSNPARIDWVLGFYAQQRNEDLDRQHFGRFASKYETERYAGYGQVIVELNDRWAVTGGFRYEQFNDEYSDTNRLITESKEGYWSGQLTAEYSFLDDVLIFGTLSRGVKPGGVNTDTSSNLPLVAATFRSFLTERQKFASETLFNKEIGIKTSLYNHRLQLRLTAFHIDRYDAQLESFTFDPSTFIFTSFLDSKSDAENYGAELELDYFPNRAVNLFANIGYLETNVERMTVFDLDRLAFRSLVDRDQAKSPNWTYNIGVNLKINDRLHGRLEVEGRDSNFFGYYHDGKIEAYALAHASVSYTLGPITAQAWMRNIFGTNYAMHGLFFANDPRDAFTRNREYFQRGEPRVFGLNLNYRF